MKILLTILISLLCLTGIAQSYNIETKSSSLTWTGHAQTGVYSPKGKLQIKSGTLTFTGGKLSAGKVTIDMSSLTTDNMEMQEHLRGKDFFDIGKYPEAWFTLDKVEGTRATGKLTIKGITQVVYFDFTITPQADKVMLRAMATIDRTQYGIKYNSASFFQDLGSYAIRNTFEIEAVIVATPVN